MSSSIRASTNERDIHLTSAMFKERVINLTEETLQSLQCIWTEAGYEDMECHGLLGELLNKLKTTCSAEIAAEGKILEHAKQEVESKSKEYISFCYQLGRNADLGYLQSMNFADKLAELEKLISSIFSIVASRQERFDTEMNFINELARTLGLSAPDVSKFSGPPGTPPLSDIKLELMLHCKEGYEFIRNKRIDEMKKVAQSCKQLILDLVLNEEGFHSMPDYKEYEKFDQSLLDFVNKDEFNFGLLPDDVLCLKNRLARLVSEKDQRRDELSKTGTEIAKLWSLLRIPSEERELFQSSFRMNLSMATVQRGNDELKRLQEIRSASIGKVVESLRSDVMLLWTELGITSHEQQKTEFPEYFLEISQIDDEMLDKFEEYLNGLKARVEELKPILLKVARREQVVQERIELEHIQLNSNRLTERGPHAREQRKREEGMASHVKNLEKATKELIATIQSWEDINGPFMFSGERYLDRITQQDNSFFEIRDSLRATKKKQSKEGSTFASINNLNNSGNTATIVNGLNNSFNNRTSTIKKVGLMSTPSSSASSHTQTFFSATKAAAEFSNFTPHDLKLLMKSTGQTKSSGLLSSKIQINDENLSSNCRNSTGSDETEYTSATEVKERSSTATFVKPKPAEERVIEER